MGGEFGEMKAGAERPLAGVDENDAVLRHLATRRSTSAADLASPGPSRASLQAMLTIAARVPDHKKLAPWRFIVIEGAARDRFGAVLARVCASREPEASAIRHETERARFLRAPTIVAVVSSPISHPAAPEWEQVLSAGAVCLNLLHAAAAYGFGAQWLTEWYGYDAQVAAAFGLAPHERIAGFVYIGTPRQRAAERERPDIGAITSFPDGPAD
jgi:nitroreductase